jgi:hypothetical protein
VKPTKIQYILQSVYKLIDLIGNDPINTIDIKLFWYDSHNNIYPLGVSLGDSISLRLVFIKKGTEKQ